MIIFILTLAFAFSKGSLSLNPRIPIFKIHLSSKWLYKCSHQSPKSDLIWYQSCRHCRQGVNVTAYLHSYDKFSSCKLYWLHSSIGSIFLSFCLIHNSPIIFSYQKSKRTELSIIWEKGNLWNRLESSQSHILL